jgi:hypothetical protein
MSRLLHSDEIAVLQNNSPLGFETAGGGSWPAWHRYLTLNGVRAYELGNVCSTCAFFFERMEGANKKVEVDSLVERLAAGISPDDKGTIQLLANMVPAGRYFVNVVEMRPTAVDLGTSTDYFVSEQQAAWGQDGFWGLPHHPRVPYYRAGERPISHHARLFEFVIPMYPRNWLNQSQISKYSAALTQSDKPTAVALSLLDVKSAEEGDGEDFEHWCLAHYVLDGHHKIEAASLGKRAIRLVSFLAIEHGASNIEQVSKLLEFLDFAE